MDNADLERLKVSPGRLTPKFHPNVTEYKATFSSDVCEIKLTIFTSDSGASTTIKGDATGKVVQLSEGSTSNIEVVVTAEDGHSTKVYKVSAHRLSANDACLSQLDVSVGKLQPSFSPSTQTYYCDLPSNVSQIDIKTKTEDPKMGVTQKGGAGGTVTLKAGLTLIQIIVTSPNGNNSLTYTINALRLQSPYCFHLKHPNPSHLCAVCNGVLHCPYSINGNTSNIYCRHCLVQLSRVNKMDPMTSRPLDEGWLIIDNETEKIISEQMAICDTPMGKIEGRIGELPSLVSQKSKEQQQLQKDTVACKDCSKTIPAILINIHKQMFCSANISCDTPVKIETKGMTMSSIHGDDSLPSNIEELLALAIDAEEKYLTTLREEDLTSCSPGDILQHIIKAGTCYTMMIRMSPKDPRGFIGLGVVLEELFYMSDMYGIKETESIQDESDAEISSKEEEFLAICKLHGVTETANLAQQLRAVEAEYKSLQQSGQSHKAEHVQQLYQWKSKKAVEASKGSISVDTESLIYKAKMKFENAVNVKPTDHTACYHYGRICLLLGDLDVAEKWLKIAASLKPTHTPTLLCLGKAIVQSNSTYAKTLIAYGLGVYIETRNDISIGKRCNNLQSFHANDLWRSTNTLIGESFIDLGNLGGHSYFNTISCYRLASRLFSLTHGLQKGSIMNQLIWMLIRARAALADIDIKNKCIFAGQMCQQTSSLINHCQLPPTEQLRTIQMKVFEDGVMLHPTNSIALMRLGAGQLQQYEAINDQTYLNNAEKSFRASIVCEGETENGTDPPLEIAEQEWWKKRKEITAPLATPTTKPSTTPTSKSTVTVTTPSKNVTKPVGGKDRPMAVKQPPPGRGRQPVGVSNNRGGKGGAQVIGRGTRGRGVATLGELKTDIKKPTTTTTATKQPQKEIPKQQQQPKQQPKQEPATCSTSGKPMKLNEVSYQPRLGLARVLAKFEDKKEESIKLYNDVIKMAPNVHDAYIELGEILALNNPTGAVAIYSKFPFSDPPSFDDAYLHGEIIRLIMSSNSYEDPQLVISMIAMGKALGIGVLDKTVGILEAKFKTKVLKKVYAGVHGKDIDNPELQAFFKFKCWT